MVNLKTLFAGAGLSVMLASGAVALTPVSGEVLTPAGAPKSAPNWMEFQPEKGDTLYGACTSFLTAAGLADKYGWGDCGGVVVKLNGKEKFLSGFKLRQDVTYLLPVAVDSTTGQVQQSSAASEAPQVSATQMAADIAILREIVDGNLPGMAEAIRENRSLIDGQSAQLDDHARSLNVLTDWAESNTQAVEEVRQQVDANVEAVRHALSAAEQAVADAEQWRAVDAELEADQNANIATAFNEAKAAAGQAQQAQAMADEAQAESAAALDAASDASTQVIGLSGRLDGMEEQVADNTTTAGRSNLALLAAAGATVVALLAFAIAVLRHRKLPGRVAEVERQQAETRAELFPVTFDETKVSKDALQKLGYGNDLHIVLPVTHNETGEVYQLRIERTDENLFRIYGVSRGVGHPSHVDCSAARIIKTIRKAGRDDRLQDATPALRSAAA